MQDSDGELLDELALATASRDIQRVDQLMQMGIDPCTSTRDGVCPIHIATVLDGSSGSAIVSRMLDYGADPNAKTPTGLSPLHIAAMWGRAETIDVLLDSGANLTDKDENNMNAFDYVEEAEDNKYDCLDALTKFRGDVKRRSGCFKTKSRFYLDRIKGSRQQILPSGSPLHRKLDKCAPSGKISVGIQTEETSRNDSLSSGDNKSISSKALDEIISEILERSRLPEDISHTPLSPAIKTVVKDSFFDQSALNDTVFQSCNTSLSESIQCIISSTMLEDSLPNSNRFIERLPCFNGSGSELSSGNGYSGDVSEAHVSEDSLEETFWSLKSSPVLFSTPCSPNITTRRRKPNHTKVRDTPTDMLRKKVKKSLNVPMYTNSESQMIEHAENKDDPALTNVTAMTEQKNIAPMAEREDSVENFQLKQDEVVATIETNSETCCLQHITNQPNTFEGFDSRFMTFDEDLNKSLNGDVIIHQKAHNTADYILMADDSLAEENISDSTDHVCPSNTQTAAAANQTFWKQSPHENGKFENNISLLLSNLSRMSLESDFNNVLNDIEATIDYSNNHRDSFPNVSQLIGYYESKTEEDDELSVTGVLTNDLQSSQLFEEITFDYDWKDVSLLNATIEEFPIVVPHGILCLSNVELRQRLIKLGVNPGPINALTKKVYQRHLTKLEKNGSHQAPQNKHTKDCALKDYVIEMRHVLLGICSYDEKESDELEREMAFMFANPEKHTWREGTQKTSFNYLLLDPRVTKNLANRGKDMEFIEQLRTFVSAVFYVGKAKKARPYEHLIEAAKYLKDDKNKLPSNKVRLICDIWSNEMGAVSVHVFHSVIPVEAYTREGCMVEALGLSRLTNLKRGEFYGPSSTWSVKKRRLLGIHLIVKAMKIYLIEGERQIRRCDLLKKN